MHACYSRRPNLTVIPFAILNRDFEKFFTMSFWTLKQTAGGKIFAKIKKAGSKKFEDARGGASGILCGEVKKLAISDGKVKVSYLLFANCLV